MAKLTITRGLPGSGKSYWAAQQKDAVVVTKDDIRASLKKPWSNDLEKEVLRIRDFKISQGLSAGKHVISADTNFGSKHEPRLRGLATKYKAEFVVNDSFLQVSVDECIRRDAGREEYERVGEKVIRDMAAKYMVDHPVIMEGSPGPIVEPLRTKPTQELTRPTNPVSPAVSVVAKLAEAVRLVQQLQETKVEETVVGMKYVEDPKLPFVVLCDLDGTLCLHDGRGPFDYDKCNTDLVNKPIRELLWAMAGDENPKDIIYLSGREEIARSKSEAWLRDNKCPVGPLYMRSKGDYRKDTIVKLELFEANIRGRFNVLCVFDDRPSILRMWRELGLTTLQVGDGHEF